MENNVEDILYGADKEEGIVAIEVDNSEVTIIFKNGKKSHPKDFKPFIYTKDADLLARTKKATATELQGNGYKYLMKTNPREYWGLLKYLRPLMRENYFSIYDMQEQYMIHSGKTLFKGMEFKDLKRLQWNIEASGLSLHDSVILVIAWKCGDNNGRLIGSEFDIIQNFINVINEQDPDVIETYNGFAYDWRLLFNRATTHHIQINIGRNKSGLYFYRTWIKLGDQPSVELEVPKVWGRHCLDLYFSVRKWDMVFRELESWKLDDVCDRFGLKLEHMDLDKENMETLVKENPQLVCDHCYSDCIATDFLSKQLTQQEFYQTQMIPLSYERLCITSPGAKMTGMFVREYYRQNQALPTKKTKNDFVGALVESYDKGIFEHVYKVDVSSLYPSIILQYKIYPKTDSLGIFLTILKSLTDLRFELKNKAKITGLERFRSAEQAHKVLINSMYGLLGASFFLFCDTDEAAKVTEKGREILKEMENIISSAGYKVLEMDTDGIYFSAKGKIDSKLFIEALNNQLPDGINCEIEYYQFFCNVLPKNYIKVNEKGEMKMSGVSFRSRGIEKFGKDFVKACVWDILHKNYWNIRKRYLHLYKDIIARKLNVQDFVQHREISKSLREYQINKKKTDQVYELLLSKNREVPVGNKISFYVAN